MHNYKVVLTKHLSLLMLQIIYLYEKNKLWSADCIHICLTKFKLTKKWSYTISVLNSESVCYGDSKDMGEIKEEK